MAAMAQIETIIFFIILVPFVSFFYDYILSDHAARKSGNLKRNSYFKALHIRALKLAISLKDHAIWAASRHKCWSEKNAIERFFHSSDHAGAPSARAQASGVNRCSSAAVCARFDRSFY